MSESHLLLSSEDNSKKTKYDTNSKSKVNIKYHNC